MKIKSVQGLKDFKYIISKLGLRQPNKNKTDLLPKQIDKENVFDILKEQTKIYLNTS